MFGKYRRSVLSLAFAAAVSVALVGCGVGDKATAVAEPPPAAVSAAAAPVSPAAPPAAVVAAPPAAATTAPADAVAAQIGIFLMSVDPVKQRLVPVEGYWL